MKKKTTKKKMLQPKRTKKFKSVQAIKEHFGEQLKPIRKAQSAAIKDFKADCRHPKGSKKRVRHSTRSEIFYDGYQPPGSPSYSHGHYFITTCEACGKELSVSREIDDYDGR